jgi:hypothetical protein
MKFIPIIRESRKKTKVGKIFPWLSFIQIKLKNIRIFLEENRVFYKSRPDAKYLNFKIDTRLYPQELTITNYN